nr:pentapeptide repeat-containing protein [uncultured Cohaesibacter sp.]
MDDKEIIKLLTPTGTWLRGHLIYLGTFVLLFSGLGLWLIFNDAVNEEARVWREFSEIARNLGLLLLGVIGLPLAIWRSTVAYSQAKTAIEQSEHTAKQIKLVQQGQLADRYAKAAAMLSDEKMSVRIAGVFALKELALADQQSYYFAIQNLYCEFIQDRSKEASETTERVLTKDGDVENAPISCPRDIVQTLEAFSDLRSKVPLEMETHAGWQPDLSGVYLYKFPRRQKGINFSGAILRNTNLRDGNFYNACFNNTDLEEANLTMVSAVNASFVETSFCETHLEQAYLRGSVFVNTNLSHCYIEHADFSGVRMDKETLEATNLLRIKSPTGNQKWKAIDRGNHFQIQRNMISKNGR